MSLSIRNVSKSYANGRSVVQALNNVTLDIPPACTACLALTVPGSLH